MKKRSFFVLKIVITVVSFIFAVLAKSDIDWLNLQNNRIDFLLAKEMVYDLSVGVFSAMILVWFIDEIKNNIKEHKSQEIEKSTIKRFSKVLEKYIERYVFLYYCVVTPIENRDFNQITMPEKFSLKDMRDLHHMTLVVNEGGFDSAVKSFFDIELTIREELISLIERYDYIYYPQFADIFLEFIQVSLSYNIRTSILEDSKRISQGKAVEVFFHEYLDKYGNEFYQKYLSGTEGGGNIMHPYAFLCDLMKKERTIIISYQNEIDKLFGKT